jgi:hypothetical protein
MKVDTWEKPDRVTVTSPPPIPPGEKRIGFIAFYLCAFLLLVDYLGKCNVKTWNTKFAFTYRAS